MSRARRDAAVLINKMPRS